MRRKLPTRSPFRSGTRRVVRRPAARRVPTTRTAPVARRNTEAIEWQQTAQSLKAELDRERRARIVENRARMRDKRAWEISKEIFKNPDFGLLQVKSRLGFTNINGKDELYFKDPNGNRLAGSVDDFKASFAKVPWMQSELKYTEASGSNVANDQLPTPDATNLAAVNGDVPLHKHPNRDQMSRKEKIQYKTAYNKNKYGLQ